MLAPLLYTIGNYLEKNNHSKDGMSSNNGLFGKTREFLLYLLYNKGLALHKSQS
jgi:hypothetical protein